MKIKKEITVDVRRKGKNFIVGGLPELTFLMGTSSVSGNLQYYGIKKKDNKYIVSVRNVKNRLKILETRKEKLEERCDMIRQFLKGEK